MMAPFMSLAATRSTDARIDEVTFVFEDYKYRTPIKFGGTEVDRVTLLNVNATIRNAAGKMVKGFGSMPLGNVWSFPSKTMPYEQTLNAMKVLTERIAKITNGYKEYGHPIDLNWELEAAVPQGSGRSVSRVEAGPAHSEALHARGRRARSMRPSTMHLANCTDAARIRHMVRI